MNRPTSRPAVTSAIAITAYPEIGKRGSAGGGRGGVAKAFSGHSPLQPEIEPPAFTCGSSSSITTDGTTARTTAATRISFEASPSRRPVGNVRISTYAASPTTFSHSRPEENNHLLPDDCKTYSAPTNPKQIRIGPKRLCGRCRSQYRPINTGPKMKSAFCAASQPGYARKSASSVIQTAAPAANTAAPAARAGHNFTPRS